MNAAPIVVCAPTLMLACAPAPAVPSVAPATTVVPAFWDPDPAVDRGPDAFGPLPVERQAARVLSVGSYELRASLPQAPHEMAVYIAGSYPATEATRVRILGEHWEFVPMLSLVQYKGSDAPLGSPGPLGDAGEATRRAEAVLRSYGQLPPDTISTGSQKNDAGLWRARFARRMSGYLDYANKGLTVSFGTDGRVQNILGRRRPLLEQSAYPTRTAQEAWTLLQSGHWRSFFVEDGASGALSVDRFVADSVEIAYVEGEVLTDHDVVRPYYVFRATRGVTLYISAIAGDL